MSWLNRKSNHENISFYCNGILLYGERVVIPASLKKKILKDFHTGAYDKFPDFFVQVFKIVLDS